jgi:hypothetical protein
LLLTAFILSFLLLHRFGIKNIPFSFSCAFSDWKDDYNARYLFHYCSMSRCREVIYICHIYCSLQMSCNHCRSVMYFMTLKWRTIKKKTSAMIYAFHLNLVMFYFAVLEQLICKTRFLCGLGLYSRQVSEIWTRVTLNEDNLLPKSYSTQSAKWWFSDHKILNTLQDERIKSSHSGAGEDPVVLGHASTKR